VVSKKDMPLVAGAYGQSFDAYRIEEIQKALIRARNLAKDLRDSLNVDEDDWNFEHAQMLANSVDIALELWSTLVSSLTADDRI
jgi:hypothetical protein